MHEALMYTFEGLDGAGKTTQVRELRTHFESQGLQVAVCISPSKTTLGQFIRGYLSDLDPWLKNRLFVLDMQHSVVNLPNNTQLVLWDRYVDSIYSSNKETRLGDIEAIVKDLPTPHRTFFLDIPPEISWEREGQVSDHPLDLEWLRMKHERYSLLSQKYPDRFFRVDATQPVMDVRENLIARIRQDIMEIDSIERNVLQYIG